MAAPGVVKRGAVAQPEDLATLPFVANGALREPLQWQFTRNDFERQTVRMNQTLTINTTPAVLAATLAGAGLSVLPDFLVMEDIKAGRLTHILPAWTLPAGGIHAVYPAVRFRPPKVTTFVAMLMEEHKRMAPTRVKRP